MTQPEVVVPDAGPLIALAKLDQLTLLERLYPNVQLTESVFQETVVQGEALGHSDGTKLRQFFERVGWPRVRVELRDDLPSSLGLGERSVLSLALTHPNCLALLDDEAARATARSFGIATRGTLGVLVAATQADYLSKTDCVQLLTAIGERPDIWISAQLCQQVARALLA